MKSKIPSYKSTFYKFIKPDDREITEPIMDVCQYKNVIKPLSFFSINEIYVSKYITNIPNYFLYFIPVLKSTTITLPKQKQEQEQKLEENGDEQSESKFSDYTPERQRRSILVYTRHLDSHHNFYQMFNNIGKSNSNSKRGIMRIIDSYKYLLHIMQILNTYQIVHLNIIPNNILFNSDNNPILSNFTNSFHLPTLNEERKSNLFKSYIPKNQQQNQNPSNIFYTQPLEVYVISFLENQENNSSLSLSNIELLCSNFTTLSFSALSIFSETYIKEYKELAVFSLRCYINKPKEYVINDLLNNSSTWNNYSLSMLYLHLLNFHFAGASIKDNQFITSFSQVLMNNIHAKVSYRCSASQTLELFEEVLYSIDAWTIASIVGDATEPKV